jgi:hypothetical protein
VILETREESKVTGMADAWQLCIYKVAEAVLLAWLVLWAETGMLNPRGLADSQDYLSGLGMASTQINKKAQPTLLGRDDTVVG